MRLTTSCGPAGNKVKARTSDGEIGVLPGHTPCWPSWPPVSWRSSRSRGDAFTLKADGGFFSVDSNRVVIVADNATVGDEVTAGNR